MVIFVFDTQHANNIPTYSPEHGDHHRAAKHSVRKGEKGKGQSLMRRNATRYWTHDRGYAPEFDLSCE